MANFDYVVRGNGGFTPYGELSAPLEPGDSHMYIAAFQAVTEDNDLEVGMGVLVGDEIVRLIGTVRPELEVARGCADTIPASHPAGTPVWFFSSTAVSDERAYAATDAIAVKVLPYSVSSGPIPTSGAPPNDLVFDWRLSRPYAPGLVLLDGVPWYAGLFELNPLATDYTLTWAHRDRILQADQLVGHNEASIGPEPGVTYEIRVYDRFGVLSRTVSGISGSSWVYDRVDALADIPAGTGTITLQAVRDGLYSWQSYAIPVRASSGGGLGDSLGDNLGGG